MTASPQEISLEERLARALDVGAPQPLIDLYLEATAMAETPVQQGFFLTHAYVHALECEDPRARMLKTRLVDLGRDQA
ncbi:MAG: hypothetical protein MK098_06660 [Marinovum sp.]|nr:hypothetical protein [Marinovum sp.]